MTKYLNKILCIAVAVAYASPAMAAVKKIENYDGTLLKAMYFGEGGVTPLYPCNGADEYKSTQSGMDCSLIPGSGGCYRCTEITGNCPAAEYPFKDCSGNGLTAGETCSDPTGTYYKTCSCASGYHDVSLWEDKFFDLSGATVVENRTSDTNLKCIVKGRIACNTATTDMVDGSEFVSSSLLLDTKKGIVKMRHTTEPLVYTAYSVERLLGEGNDSTILGGELCIPKNHGYVDEISGVSSFNDNLGNHPCAIKNEATSRYADGRRYFYYSSECSDAPKCNPLVSSDVVSTATSVIPVYAPLSPSGATTLKCPYVNGCNTIYDKVSNKLYFHDGTTTVMGEDALSHISFTEAFNSGDGIICKIATGCTNGYTTLRDVQYADDPESAISNEINTLNKTNKIAALYAFSDPNNPSLGGGFILCTDKIGVGPDEPEDPGDPEDITCPTTDDQGRQVCGDDTALGAWLACFQGSRDSNN